MDNIDVAIALLAEAKEERDRVEKYERELHSLPHASEVDYWVKYYEFCNRWENEVPSKQIVKDNLKTARRLILKEFKKI